MAKSLKFRASKQIYIPRSQLIISGFETPFAKELDQKNRWVIMAGLIPWDDIIFYYQKNLKNRWTGARSINPRIAIGSLIVKFVEDLSDRDTITHIQENPYIQYFLGLGSFVKEPLFDASSLVDFRKRLSLESLNEINEILINRHLPVIVPKSKVTSEESQEPVIEVLDQQKSLEEVQNPAVETPVTQSKFYHGKMIIDATAFPQDITYPTDIKLIYACIEKSQIIIDKLYDKKLHKKKPRTDRPNVRKQFLNVAQSKKPSKAKIQKGIKLLLTNLGRNIKSIHGLLEVDKKNILLKRLKPDMYKYLLVIQTVHDQQKEMYREKKHQIGHRIVSIHQPHVRPIVRGKAHASTEFGSKVLMSIMEGYTFLDLFSWEAYNEGIFLIESVDLYHKRFGYYPEKVLADKIFCNRENRKKLKELGIMLGAKPLGRPKAEEPSLVSPGERNPIEAERRSGIIGQGKTRYGLNRIKARLDITSKSWIACTLMVLNLIKLIREASLWLVVSVINNENAIGKLLIVQRVTKFKLKMAA